MNPVDIRLYGILGPQDTHGRDLAACARAAADGGTTIIQLRDKHSDARILVEEARALKAALAGTGVTLVVNDRVDIALAADLDGVHLGQSDMDPVDARRLLGPDKIIGITLKTESDARALADQPVDYGCIGGVFATTSKDNPAPPIGLAGLAQVAAIARETRPGMPVGAIAGINLANLRSTIGAGADGVAVISALFAHDDIAGAAHGLRQAIDAALAGRGA
ncbi:MAG: thiamine phosphate synthase [Salinarimonas sp.]|nr:thiamine phosphate synthase [Salinarimonas sp.]